MQLFTLARPFVSPHIKIYVDNGYLSLDFIEMIQIFKDGLFGYVARGVEDPLFKVTSNRF